MNQNDGRDNRLRKLFSKLPRAEAPGNFEEHLMRRLGQPKTHPDARHARLRAFAIPGLALLLVGALSYVLYLTQFRTPVDEMIPQKDTLTAPRGASVPDRPESGDAAVTVPAPADEGSQAGPDGRSADKPTTPPDGSRREPSSVERMKMGKTTPGRPMMIESSVPETAIRLDSVAVKDTASVDSTQAMPDSLLDSLKIRKPD